MANQPMSVQQHNHRKLLAWQQSIALVEHIYHVTKPFPKDETFGLTAQLRRSAVSVPSNIAEGAGRNSTKELVQFLGIASGSLAEVDTQLEIAMRLGYLDGSSDVFGQVSRVGQLLVALRRSLKSQ